MNGDTKNVLSLAVATVLGTVVGGFSVLLFMFSYVATQAKIDARLEAHIEEYRLSEKHRIQEAETCARDRERLRDTIYSLREKINAIANRNPEKPTNPP